MQTTGFLNDHADWQQISVVNTAIAAQKVVKDGDKAQAAVCSAYAAKIHGLEVLADNINDEPDNCTRIYCGDESEGLSEACVKDQY